MDQVQILSNGCPRDARCKLWTNYVGHKPDNYITKPLNAADGTFL